MHRIVHNAPERKEEERPDCNPGVIGFDVRPVLHMQRVRVEGPPPVLKTGAPQGWLFDSATLCQIFQG